MGVIYKNGINYGGGGGNGTSDYIEITNKPQINGITLEGNQNTADLKLADNNTIYVNNDGELTIEVIPMSDIEALFA